MTLLPLSKIQRATYNPRIMPDTEMEALMKSLSTFGFVEPVVVNKREVQAFGGSASPDELVVYVLVGGHQRCAATERLIASGKPPKGVEEKDGLWFVPAMVVELDDEQEKALNLALNKIRGKWDEGKLGEIIVSLKESDILPSTGFREDEVSKILDGMQTYDNVNDAAKATDVEPAEPRSKPGEIYELGPHRLICGDSTDPYVIDKLLNGAKAAMLWTDPPYNVAYKSRGAHLKDQGKESIKNDHMSPEDFRALIDKAFATIPDNLEPGGAMYICSGWSSYATFLESLTKNGFEHHGVIIWTKNVASMGWNDYRYKHEWIAKAKKPKAEKTAEAIIYGWKTSGTHSFYGDNEYDVWEMPRKTVQHYLHPTEKPDWLPMRAIRNSSKRGEIVLDLFAGSGSVMSACEKTGRCAYMVELDPKFCDVIRDRWEKIEKAKEQNE